MPLQDYVALEQVTRSVHAHLPVGQYFPSIRVFQDLARQSQGCPDPVTGDISKHRVTTGLQNPFLPTFVAQHVKELAPNLTQLHKKSTQKSRMKATQESLK